MTVTTLGCQCRRCRRDAIDERLMRQFLRCKAAKYAANSGKFDPEAESLARAVADLNDEMAGVGT